MIKKIIILVAVLLASCKSIKTNTNNRIILYQRVNLVSTPFTASTDPIRFWDFKEEGNVDSITIKKNKKIQKFYSIFNDLEKTKALNQYVLCPEYAIIFNYQNKLDTLYLDCELEIGLFVQNNMVIKDSTAQLYHYFKDEKFLTLATAYFVEENPFKFRKRELK